MSSPYQNTANRRGQVMVLTLMVLSSTFLAATTIGGLLMVYQIRQSSDFVLSSQAITAADAGIEYRLCMFFRNDAAICGNLAFPLTFGNGARLEAATIECYNAVEPMTPPGRSCDDPTVRRLRIKATGVAGSGTREARRMLQLDTTAF